MVKNHYSKCKYCNTKFRLRFQVGSHSIPVSFSCPNCSVKISGAIIIKDDKPRIECKIPNLMEIDEETADYVVEQSLEFFQRKIYKEEMKFDISPFMKMAMAINDFEQIQSSFDKINRVFLFKQTKLQTIIDISEITKSKKDLIAIDYCKKKFPRNNIKNILDCYMKVHQELVMGCAPLLPDSMLSDFSSMSRKMLTEVLIKAPEKTDEMYTFLSDDDKLSNYEENMFEVIIDFISMFDKFIPLVISMKTDTLRDINQEEYGISTIGFDELKDFYSKSYELILKSIDVVFILNNLTVRGDYSNIVGNDTFKTFDDIYDKTNKSSKKIEKLISESDPFSEYITDVSSIIRNSIDHESYEVDDINQKIKFIDKFKDRERIEEISFIDFAKKCYDNFIMSIYISELLYNLKKFKYITYDGLMPNYVVAFD